MLSKTLSRALPRTSNLLPPTTSLSRPFSNAIRRNNASLLNGQDINVPVISYRDGVRTETAVPMTDPPVVKPPGEDIKKKAHRLDPSIREKLTPTLQKFTLTDKVAVVTGGGRGLGYNMAQALAEAGIKGIAILDVLKEDGEQAARDLAEETGVDVRFYPVDITNERAVQKMVQDIVGHYGRIDVLINSAGIADSNLPAETYPLPKFKNLISINLTGSFIVAQAVAQSMLSTGTRGSIIFIASMSGSIVNYPQEQSCYNASKAGVIQLSKSLAAEWAKYGIRVNSISPGYMDTALNRVKELDAQKKVWVERTPMGRLGAVDELNCLAVFVAGGGEWVYDGE